ncbi:MAG: branched chain amino acid aminotransferase [Chloroflexi bacterium]|nr:MAG: branched chain amino acid aminotransferase [Chloroflexota bacterium]
MADYAFFNKQFVPLSEAKMGIMTHALHYGTACFDGIRGNWNEEEKQMYLFRVRDHHQRLKKNSYMMKIDLPYSVDELCRITVELVEKNGYHEDIYIRPLAYKSSQAIGVRIHNLDDDFLMFVTPFGPYLDIEKGCRCCVSTWRRIDDNVIPPRAKVTGLYVNSAMAKTEAWENGFDEAIILNQDGHVSEGSGENVFIVSDGKLLTPPSSDNILVGITRDTVIKLAKNELGIDTVERSVDRTELYLADECFLTGTAAHLTPVIEIDHRKIGDGTVGEITKKLQQLYFDVIRGKNSKYIDWCTPAYSSKAIA